MQRHTKRLYQVSSTDTSDGHFGNVAALGVSGQERDTEVEEYRWNYRHSNSHLKVSFDTPRVLASGEEMDPLVGGDEGPDRSRYFLSTYQPVWVSKDPSETSRWR
ncbi:hypothetical protein FALCPG4_003465 [Fusarium falciforme]